MAMDRIFKFYQRIGAHIRQLYCVYNGMSVLRFGPPAHYVSTTRVAWSRRHLVLVMSR